MKANPAKQVNQMENDSFSSTTTIAALLFLAAKFPHRQFNSAELCVLSGIGRTAMSQISLWVATHMQLATREVGICPRNILRFADSQAAVGEKPHQVRAILRLAGPLQYESRQQSAETVRVTEAPVVSAVSLRAKAGQPDC